VARAAVVAVGAVVVPAEAGEGARASKLNVLHVSMYKLDQGSKAVNFCLNGSCGTKTLNINQRPDSIFTFDSKS
jgi:hypothetical protein